MITKEKFKQQRLVMGQIATSTLLCISVNLPSLCYAANDLMTPIEVDIGAILQTHSYNVGDASSIMIAVPSDDPNQPGSWQSGIVSVSGKMIRGSLGVSSSQLVEGFAPESALRIRPGIDGLQGILVDACSGGRCRPAAVEVSAPHRYIVRSENVAYTLNVYGDICSPEAVSSHGNPEESCSVLLPSWTLALMAKQPDKSIPYFPRTIAATQVNDHLLLIDIEQAKVAFDFELENNGPTAQLGRLRNASFHTDGNLVLTFDEGGLILGFAQDMALLVRADGSLFVKDSGLGKGDLRGFTPATAANGGKNRGGDGKMRLLSLAPNLAITDRGATSFHFQHNGGVKKLATITSDGTWQQAHLVEGDPSKVKILIVQPSGAATLTLTLTGNDHELHLKKSAEASAVLRAGVAEFRLLRGDIFIRRGDGWLLPSDSLQDTTMVIPGQRLSERALASTGSLLIKRQVSNALTCDWTRHKHASSAERTYFEEGGFRTDCKATVEFNLANSNGAEAAIVRNSSGIIKAFIFVPQH